MKRISMIVALAVSAWSGIEYEHGRISAMLGISEFQAIGPIEVWFDRNGDFHSVWFNGGPYCGEYRLPSEIPALLEEVRREGFAKD